MARYRYNPGNPDILGADAWDLLWEGVVGVGGTAVLTDRLTGPLLRGVVPGASAGALIGKAVDAFATVLSGWLGAKFVRMVYPAAARGIERGAALLTVAKIAAAVLPGYSPLGPLPIPSTWGQLGAPKQLAEGNGKANGQLPAASARLGVGTMGI